MPKKKKVEEDVWRGDDERLSLYFFPLSDPLFSYPISSRGLPLQKILVWFGGKGSGKSTYALQLVAEVQKSGVEVTWLDSEGSYTPEYASSLGVDTSSLEVVPTDLTGAFKHMARVFERASKKKPQMVVWDSISQADTDKDAEDDFGSLRVGGTQAGPLTQSLRKLRGLMRGTDPREKPIILWWLAQVRADIGNPYGGERLPGGNAFAHNIDVLIHAFRGRIERRDNQPIGWWVTLTRKWSRISATNREPLHYLLRDGGGFDRFYTLFALAKARGIFKQRGPRYESPLMEKSDYMIHILDRMQEDEEFYNAVQSAVFGDHSG